MNCSMNSASSLWAVEEDYSLQQRNTKTHMIWLTLASVASFEPSCDSCRFCTPSHLWWDILLTSVSINVAPINLPFHPVFVHMLHLWSRLKVAWLVLDFIRSSFLNPWHLFLNVTEQLENRDFHTLWEIIKLILINDILKMYLLFRSPK